MTEVFSTTALYDTAFAITKRSRCFPAKLCDRRLPLTLLLTRKSQFEPHGLARLPVTGPPALCGDGHEVESAAPFVVGCGDALAGWIRKRIRNLHEKCRTRRSVPGGWIAPYETDSDGS